MIRCGDQSLICYIYISMLFNTYIIKLTAFSKKWLLLSMCEIRFPDSIPSLRDSRGCYKMHTACVVRRRMRYAFYSSHVNHVMISFRLASVSMAPQNVFFLIGCMTAVEHYIFHCKSERCHFIPKSSNESQVSYL